MFWSWHYSWCVVDGVQQQALELCEEKMMRTGVLVGRFAMVILVLCWNPAWGAPSLAAGETRGILRCFSASPALQCRGAASTFGTFWLSLQPFELNTNICFWCPTVSDLGLAHLRGSFEIKHFFLKGGVERGMVGSYPEQSSASSLLEGRCCSSVFSRAPGMLLLQGAASFCLQGLLLLPQWSKWPWAGELQLQAGERKQCKALSVYCISWALQNVPPVKIYPVKCWSLVFSFRVLSEYIMQWALGFWRSFKPLQLQRLGSLLKA